MNAPLLKLAKLTFECESNVARIGFGKFESKSLTTLCEQSLKELEQVVAQVELLAEKKEIKGVLFFSHKKDCFLAGVDVSLIRSLSTSEAAQRGAEQGQRIYNRIEDLGVPTLALVDGVCLGGGLELALSCTAIWASTNSKTQLGLPEVKLGVLPGFGGTYRLPKKIGLAAALEIILSGNPVNTSKGVKLGLIDECFDSAIILNKAVNQLTSQLPLKKAKRDSVAEEVKKHLMDNFVGRRIIFQKTREMILKKTKGHYRAPLKIIEVIEEGYGKKRSSYLISEATAFGELCSDSQAKGLQHVFFLMDSAKKNAKESCEDAKINRGAVLGAGTMGGGIAWLLASSNLRPLMKDLGQAQLELGLKQSGEIFYQGVKRKKITVDAFHRLQRSITPTLDFQGFKGVDLVIEAIVEDMKIKQKVLSEVENEVGENCLITTNTSSLSVTEMSKNLKRPDKFAGLHFFNPVDKMPLVEIIRHPKVSEETINRLVRFTVDAKKIPVVVGDGPGFLVNRILMPLLNESAYLLEEGLSPAALDAAILNFGMPMGPCRLMDEIGIDVLVKVAKIINQGLGERAKPAEFCEKLVAAKLLGRKTQKGIYDYDDRGKSVGLSPEVKPLLPQKELSLTETEIQMRVILPMINEASYVLQDEIVKSPADVDLGLLFGIGFPPFRGGVLKYADQEGVGRLVPALERLSASVSYHRFQPSPYLQKLIKDQKKFYDA